VLIDGQALGLDLTQRHLTYKTYLIGYNHLKQVNITCQAQFNGYMIRQEDFTIDHGGNQTRTSAAFAL